MMRIAQYTVLTLLLTAALFLASCQIGKPYARPEMQLPEQLDTLQQDSTTIADYKWWEIYSDTTLQRLIDQALEYNKDLNMAASRMRQLAQMKRIDFAEFFPQFDAHISSEDENMNYGGDNLDMDFEHQTLVDIAWEIDLWGNLRWKRDISMAEFLASIENQRALQMSIIAQVAESYFELVALDNELSIVQQTLEARKEGLHLAHIRFTGGLTSEMAYQQANVELAKTMTLVPDLERRIEKKESEIAFLTGSFPKRIERNRLPEEISLPDTLPVGLPSTLLERRPDIRRAEQQLVAANAAVGASYTDMFPRLRLTSHLGLESDALKTFLVSPYTFVYGIIGAPIFEFGKNRAVIVFGLIGAVALTYVLTIPVAVGHFGENAFYGMRMIANQMINNNIFVDNAFGFYGMATLNGRGFNSTASILNLVFILVLVVYICSLYFKKRNRQEVLLLASYTLAMVAVFTLKVTYTYLFLTIALGLIYAMVSGERRVYGIMGGYALLSFICVGLIVKNSGFAAILSDGLIVDFERTGADFIVFSVFTVLLTLYYSYVVYNITNTGKVSDVKPLYKPLGAAIKDGFRSVADVFKKD